jgi:hypothetical protein
MIGIVPTGVEFRHGEGIAGRVLLFEYRNRTLSIGFSTKRVVYKRQVHLTELIVTLAFGLLERFGWFVQGEKCIRQ